MGQSPSYIGFPASSPATGPGAAPAAAPAPAADSARSDARWVGLLVAGACWAVVGVAAWLSPDPSGTGTHTQLGLPACGMLARTGWPCPTCGMTTAFAAMAHAQAGRAFRAQPAGATLFLAVAALGLLAGVQAAVGRGLLGRVLRPWMAVAAAALIVLGWAVLIWLGVADGSLPVR